MNNLYFGPNFAFWGTALGRFSQCFFYCFVVGQPWWPTFLLSQSQLKGRRIIGEKRVLYVSEIYSENLDEENLLVEMGNGCA